MRKNFILGLAVAGLALHSMAALAGADQYPAANFEPKVVYLDQNAVAATKASSSSVATPCPSPASNSSAKIVAAVEKVDPKYPAASFNPTVIYP